MANAKRTSDITVALYEWNKLTTRNIAEDEKEYFHGGIEFIWEGKTPEIDEEVLVYNPSTQNISISQINGKLEIAILGEEFFETDSYFEDLHDAVLPFDNIRDLKRIIDHIIDVEDNK